MELVNTLWRLAQYPADLPTEQDIVYGEEALQPLRSGEVKIRICYVSIDPANRLWIRPEGSYLPPFPLGSVMPAACIGVVEESRHPRYDSGHMVQGLWGWQRYAILDGGPPDDQLSMQDGGILHLPDPPPGTTYLDFFGLFGVHGLTAYFGMTDVGKVKAGETVLVSAAAGAVGSLATQIAKNLGCRVIGLAGGEAKCQKVVEQYGADACIDYRSDDLRAKLSELAPNGVDVYFDNVGGEILEAAIDRMAHYGRIVFCGAISQYNEASPSGPGNYMQLLYKEIQLKGFLVLTYMERMEEAIAALAKWSLEGKLHMDLDVRDGIEHCLAAFLTLFDGSNRGKLIVRFSDP
ncbi:MAG: NADP-dependent oxidoreductase [Pseudomonadota bacterium]